MCHVALPTDAEEDRQPAITGISKISVAKMDPNGSIQIKNDYSGVLFTSANRTHPHCSEGHRYQASTCDVDSM